ncbi:hypothetical protein GXP71_00530 [Cellulomonas sp. H30R-01]|uniref:HAAS signaling domain-containing protein n=1 Tax=Cellulomonas sp. H30R-01 TaxID=2704467 RepID=UPI00138D75A1|nr:hypothetical protein [Cellulomonas sp. H30R-01]QHT54733.1 hypothetical protein GXP71_00530 [Cellulomonas sp. H30R-01]
MTTTRLPARLEAYLADLDRALVGTDARERAETIQAMREHAAEVLARDGDSDATVQRVIAELGPVEQIAASTTPAPPSPAPVAWADVWLLVCAVASLALFVFPLVAVAALVWAIVRLRGSAGSRALQKAALVVSVASVVLATGLLVSHWVS